MAKVRLIAVNPKYRTLPFFCVPVYDEAKRTYKTGQEDMTPEELSKEPLVIDPDTQYPVRHMEEYDTTKRKDQIMLALIKTQETIAPKSSLVVAGRHLFYLQNIEEEAGENVSKIDKMFDALAKVKENTSIGRQKDIAIFLGIDVSQPISVIQDRIYRFCQNEPEKVLEFFDENSATKLFVMKLRQYNIISMRDGKYLDNEIFVGRSIEEVMHFVQDRKNEAHVTRWGYRLDKIEGTVTFTPTDRNALVEKKNAALKAADASVTEINSPANGSDVPEQDQIPVDHGQPQGAAPTDAVPARSGRFQKGGFNKKPN